MILNPVWAINTSSGSMNCGGAMPLLPPLSPKLLRLLPLPDSDTIGLVKITVSWLSQR